MFLDRSLACNTPHSLPLKRSAKLDRFELFFEIFPSGLRGTNPKFCTVNYIKLEHNLWKNHVKTSSGLVTRAIWNGLSQCRAWGWKCRSGLWIDLWKFLCCLCQWRADPRVWRTSELCECYTPVRGRSGRHGRPRTGVSRFSKKKGKFDNCVEKIWNIRLI